MLKKNFVLSKAFSEYGALGAEIKSVVGMKAESKKSQ